MGENFTQRRYEQMLANSATAAVCAGPDGLIVSWNTAAEQLFGHTALQALGQPLSLIIPERSRAAHNAGIARAVKSGKSGLAGQAVEMLALHANGAEIPVDLSLSMWFEDGEPMFGALLRNTADRQLARERLEHLAHFDALTSLPNRNALHQRLEAEINRFPCSLLLIDLDEFKLVNDSLGHSVGDQLLKAVAARLLAATKPDEFVSRLGGDEFAIFVRNCADPLLLHDLAERIKKILIPPFELAQQSVYVGASIGIAMSSIDAVGVDKLLSCADLALYSAKADGGGVRKFFAHEMQRIAEQRNLLGSQLHHAFENDEFELWYQPQVSLLDDSLIGVEALLRWRHPDRGLLSPFAFIEVLESSAIAAEVGDWILRRACKTMAEWGQAGIEPLRVGVNLFAAQLRAGKLFEVVSGALEEHGLSPNQLELEITENTVLRHRNPSMKALRKLRSMGVGVSFDDFGTGFASLSLIQKYPLTRLKIDRSFVAQFLHSSGDVAIVKAVIGIAKSLGLSVTAEGVETVEQEAALRFLGCDEAQGYRYGRSMPPAKFMKFYSDRRNVEERFRGRSI